jgi:hypothetical protein
VRVYACGLSELAVEVGKVSSLKKALQLVPAI